MLYGSTFHGTCLKGFGGRWLIRSAVIAGLVRGTVVLIRRRWSLIIGIRIVIAAIFSQNTGGR